MKKQTAVEWLQIQIDNKDMGEIPMWVYEFINQSKAIEKDQIILANEDCSTNELGELLSGEQYYKETYGK